MNEGGLLNTWSKSLSHSCLDSTSEKRDWRSVQAWTWTPPVLDMAWASPGSALIRESSTLASSCSGGPGNISNHSLHQLERIVAAASKQLSSSAPKTLMKGKTKAGR